MKQRMTYYFSILLLALIAVFPSTAAADSARWTVKSFQIYEANLNQMAADQAWGYAKNNSSMQKEVYGLTDNLWIGWYVDLYGDQAERMQRDMLVEFVDPDGKKLAKTSFQVKTNSSNQGTYSSGASAFLHPVKSGEYKIRVLVKSLFQYELIQEKTFRVFSSADLRVFDQQMRDAMQHQDYELFYQLAQTRLLIVPDDLNLCFQLGLMIMNGYGTKQDEKKGFKLVEKAAQAGLPQAQSSLAGFYFSGRVVGRNLEAAENWMRKAAVQGDQQAQKDLEFIVQTRQEAQEAAARRSEQEDMEGVADLAVGMNVEVIRWHSGWRNVDYGYTGIVRELDGPYAVIEVTGFYNVNSYVEGGPETGGSDLYKNQDVGKYVRVKGKYITAIIQDS